MIAMLNRKLNQLRDWLLQCTHHKALAEMESLLQRIAAGDESAVEGVVSTYGDLVWRVAVRRLGRDHPELDDAVQNAFVEVWRHAGRYDPSRGTEAAFIGIIAARRTIDILRQGSSSTAHIDRSLLEPKGRSVPGNSESNSDTDMMSVFRELREEEQDALRLRYHAGMSYDEIATALDSKPATIRSRVFQGLRRLRAGISSTTQTESAQTSHASGGQHNG
ncbi:MAG: ECF RNA polymerase sigma factor SigK [Phycisphaerales bacterium]